MAAVVAAARAVGVAVAAELVVAASVLVAVVGRLALVGLSVGLAVPREPALHPRAAVRQRLPAGVLRGPATSDQTLADTNGWMFEERVRRRQKKLNHLQGKEMRSITVIFLLKFLWCRLTL